MSCPDHSELKTLIKDFVPYAQKRMGFTKKPRVLFRRDSENAKNVLGKTAHYDPQSFTVVLYVNNRHPKDIMRSLSHELVHHTQNCRGEFDKQSIAGEQGYAQKDPHLREMEREAYELGNMCFRDWEDNYKVTKTNYNVTQMSISEWRNLELNKLVTERLVKGVK
tara:strand:+ start:23765 stop:24259 length:495 start_codon:yes stop_codon:yes gene_type:complete